jgi:hypothetical protein
MEHMPRRVSKRIMEACQKREAVVVVPGRHRPFLPSRVFSLEKYLKMKELPKKHKPWTARNVRKSADPLRAIEGRVLEPVRRKTMYDET